MSENSTTGTEQALLDPQAANEAEPRVSYPKAVVEELSKTVWPTRSELFRNTAITLVFTVVATAGLAGADYGISELVGVVFGG
jgi:preprotein translocase SecE subunit